VNFTVDAYPDRMFYGTVTQVRNSPTTVNNVVTYDCVIGVTNSDNKLKPGMTATVSITIAQRDNALIIPNGALRFHPPENAVVDTNSTPPPWSPAANSTGNFAGGAGGHHGAHGHVEHAAVHTVYVLVDEGKDPKLRAVQIKTGITDGISTEVVSGLEEGDQVVTSVMLTGAQAAGANPFGGGFPRMR